MQKIRKIQWAVFRNFCTPTNQPTDISNPDLNWSWELLTSYNDMLNFRTFDIRHSTLFDIFRQFSTFSTFFNIIQHFSTNFNKFQHFSTFLTDPMTQNRKKWLRSKKSRFWEEKIANNIFFNLLKNNFGPAVFCKCFYPFYTCIICGIGPIRWLKLWKSPIFEEKKRPEAEFWT